MLIALTALLVTITLSSVAAAEARSPQSHRVKIALELARGLQGTPMAAQAWRLEATGRRLNVSPYFIALAAGRESSFGVYGCRGNPKNVWGFASCRTGNFIDVNGDGHVDDLPVFKTWGHAFTFFALYVRARFPRARSAWDFHGYCECGISSWAGRLEAIAHRLGWPTQVKYRGLEAR